MLERSIVVECNNCHFVIAELIIDVLSLLVCLIEGQIIALIVYPLWDTL